MRILRHIKAISWLIAVFLLAGCAVATTGNIIPVAEGVPENVIEIIPEEASAAATGTALAQTASGTSAPTASASTLEYTPTATPGVSRTPELAATPEPEPTYAVEDVEHVDGYVYAKTVNLRAKPTTDSEILAEFERYDELVITGKYDKWYRVKIDGMRGYMLKEFVQIGEVPNNGDGAEATAAPSGTAKPETGSASTDTGSFTEAELLLVAQLVSQESGKTMDGYRAVANVVYNRVMSSRFPDTVEGVVFQGNGAQFSPAKDEDELRSITPGSDIMQAVREVFSGNTILDSDVLYFRAASKGTYWSSKREYAGTYGGNSFFK